MPPCMRWRLRRLSALFFGLSLPTAAGGEAAVAYLHRDGVYWQAWMMNADGSGARALTRSPSEKIALSSFSGGRSVLVTTEQGEVLRVGIADGREQVLVLPRSDIADAAVSPDGKQIAFSVSPARSRDDHEVYLVNLDGTGLRQLTNERRVQHQPVWHPDGRSLFFVSRANDDSHDVWRALLPGGSLEQVTVGRGLHFDVDVRADGALAYSNNAGGNYEVWVQFPGQAPRALTDHPAVDGAPAWSPDGRELLFESSRSGQLELWRVSAEGGEPTRVSTTPAGARRPVWLRAAQ
jgi:TolB protein